MLFNHLVKISRIKLFYSRLKNNEYCFVTLKNDKIIGYVWVTKMPDKNLDGFEVILFKEEMCLHNLYILPGYRREGIATTLVLYVINYLNQFGCKYLIALVDKENVASLKLFKKLQAKETERIPYKFIFLKGYFLHKGLNI